MSTVRLADIRSSFVPQTIGRTSIGNTSPVPAKPALRLVSPIGDKPHRGFLSVARGFIPGLKRIYGIAYWLPQPLDRYQFLDRFKFRVAGQNDPALSLGDGYDESICIGYGMVRFDVSGI